jgi:hypothetical protein
MKNTVSEKGAGVKPGKAIIASRMRARAPPPSLAVKHPRIHALDPRNE